MQTLGIYLQLVAITLLLLVIYWRLGDIKDLLTALTLHPATSSDIPPTVPHTPE
ncbi:MAG: hypothetical protein MUO24_02295 [Desulfobacterales bacterium]|nr:hypothetical protein [Desulfobacterales bacterium]